MKSRSIFAAVLLSFAGTGLGLRGSGGEEIAMVKALEEKTWVA